MVKIKKEIISKAFFFLKHHFTLNFIISALINFKGILKYMINLKNLYINFSKGCIDELLFLI